MTTDEEIRRGNQAKQLLEHPLLIEAFSLIESEIIDAWKTSPQRDAEGREKLHLTLCLLEKLKAQIAEVVTTGKIAEKQSLLEQAKQKLGQVLSFGS